MPYSNFSYTSEYPKHCSAYELQLTCNCIAQRKLILKINIAALLFIFNFQYIIYSFYQVHALFDVLYHCSEIPQEKQLWCKLPQAISIHNLSTSEFLKKRLFWFHEVSWTQDCLGCVIPGIERLHLLIWTEKCFIAELSF